MLTNRGGPAGVGAPHHNNTNIRARLLGYKFFFRSPGCEIYKARFATYLWREPPLPSSSCPPPFLLVLLIKNVHFPISAVSLLGNSFLPLSKRQGFFILTFTVCHSICFWSCCLEEANVNPLHHFFFVSPRSCFAAASKASRSPRWKQ